jgi:L-iditol 2-dehydrogenase
VAGRRTVGGLTVRAVVYQGPEDLAVTDVPEPVLHPGDVRVTVVSAGVCGTDVRIFKGEHSAYADGIGRVPGHEIVGHVAEADTLPPGLALGDLVFVAPNIGCGRCRQCTRGNENLCATTEGIGITVDGGFAEQVVVPARAVARGNLIRLDDACSADAAVLIEPLACVLRGQDKINVRAGDTVLVGGGGPVGLLHVALAKTRGASLIICSEPSPDRRAAARTAGAAVVVDPGDLDSAMADATGGAGIDVVITAAPAHALQAAALHLAAPTGRVLFFGGLPRSRPTVELDTNTIHYKELIVAGTTASTLDDCRRAAELVDQGHIDLEWMVSDRVGLTDFAEAIAKVQAGAARKVVIKPSTVKETAG